MLSNLRAKRDQGETPGSPALPPYRLHAAQAIGAGFLAAAMGSSGARAASSLDIQSVLGTAAAQAIPMSGPTALLVGTLWHSVNGIVFALAYAEILLVRQKQSTVPTGLTLGLVLWLAAMLILPVLIAMEPSVRSGRSPNPGFFLLGLGMGWTPALFVLLDHLVYGMLVGAIYKHDIARKA